MMMMMVMMMIKKFTTIQLSSYEPVREKTNNLGSPPGLIQTGLYSHRRQLEA